MEREALRTILGVVRDGVGSGTVPRDTTPLPVGELEGSGVTVSRHQSVNWGDRGYRLHSYTIILQVNAEAVTG